MQKLDLILLDFSGGSPVCLGPSFFWGFTSNKMQYLVIGNVLKAAHETQLHESFLIESHNFWLENSVSSTKYDCISVLDMHSKVLVAAPIHWDTFGHSRPCLSVLQRRSSEAHHCFFDAPLPTFPFTEKQRFWLKGRSNLRNISLYINIWTVFYAKNNWHQLIRKSFTGSQLN